MVVGYHELPLWTNFLSYQTDLSAPFYSSVLPQNRFSQILTNIRVNGIASIPKINTDKCVNIETDDQLNSNFVKLYIVPRDHSVDKRIMFFNGWNIRTA